MRRALGLAVSSALLFLSIPSAPHHSSSEVAVLGGPEMLLLSEFYPCAPRSDEYFAVANAGSRPVSLRNWSVTDGEGTVIFANDLIVYASRSVRVSANVSSFRCAFGEYPEVSLANRSTVSCTGTFKLADGGDALWLKRPDGSIADYVAYGDVEVAPSGWSGQPLPRIRQGEVAKRIVSGSAVRDTNCSADWCPFREYRYGFTETPVFSSRVPGGALVAFVSPDCSLDTILAGVQSARMSLSLCTYELGSVPVCHELINAIMRGVSVRLLVDGAPAGGLKDDEVACLSVLASRGASVLAVNGNLTEDSVQHVGALHAKYMVVDRARSYVLSENFVKSGLPSDALFGNRGWGIEIVDNDLAAHLQRVFDSDSREDRPDVLDWRRDSRHNRSAILPLEPEMVHRQPALLPFVASNEAWVQAIVSPDASVNAPFLAPLIATSHEILISQFQADVDWDLRWTGTITSPLVDSVVTSMRGGASVSGLFDSSWYNLDRNKRIVGLLAGYAKNESLDGEFAQLDPRSPISILHNKGMILDGKKTLISSNNWCFASFARNRELALLVDSVEVASYFREAFEMDWTPDTIPPVANAGLNRTSLPGSEIALDAGGSKDDRAIAEWAWDLGADGSADCHEMVYVLKFDRPGKYRIALEVTDAWGNKDTDTVYIEVTDAPGARAPALLGKGPWWAPLATGILGTLAGAMLARRRLRAQKVNHGGGT